MPKFVIGVGSQRAGSTLLHKILDECTEIFMHPVKELHYYDTLYDVRDSKVLKKYSQKQIEREIDRLIKCENFSYIDKRYKCYLRTNKILSKGGVRNVKYIDLYRPCVMGNDFLGEITPEYMILPEEGIEHLRKDVGDAFIILLTRDPVDRFLSAYKLLKAYNNDFYDSEHLSDSIRKDMELMPVWMKQQDLLNDYKSAELKFRKFFNNVLVLSYEDLVKNPERFISQLSGFLDITFDSEKVKSVMAHKVNSIGDSGVIDSSLKNDLYQRYKLLGFY